MTDWQDAIKSYGLQTAKGLRYFGIEITPEELVREALKDAVRENLKQAFLNRIQGEKE